MAYRSAYNGRRLSTPAIAREACSNCPSFPNRATVEAA